MNGAEVAQAIQRDMQQVCSRTLYLGVGNQLPDATPNIQLPTVGDAEVRFALRASDMGALDSVILREVRDINDPPSAPWRYYYGLVQTLPDGRGLYEGYHAHGHLLGPVEFHYHLKVDGTTVDRIPTLRWHAEAALADLLYRYQVRLSDLET
jgi:hypothetical protein